MRVGFVAGVSSCSLPICVHGCGRGKGSFFPAHGSYLIHYTDNGLFTNLKRLKRQTVNHRPNHFAPLDKPNYRFMEQLIHLSVLPLTLRFRFARSAGIALVGIGATISHNNTPHASRQIGAPRGVFYFRARAMTRYRIAAMSRDRSEARRVGKEGVSTF